SSVPEKPGDHQSSESPRSPSEWPNRLVPPESPTIAAPDPTADILPARIGRYAIQRKLGEGGMGVVYAARDDRLERTIAVKTLSAQSADDTARQRLWREARAAASVNHPNVCQIYEVGEDAGRVFIAMELLEGQPLADRLRQGPMSVAETM